MAEYKYEAEITSVSELSSGLIYEVAYTIYDDKKENQWDEVRQFSVSEYPTVQSIIDYIIVRIKYYEDSSSFIVLLKDEVGVKIKP